MIMAARTGNRSRLGRKPRGLRSTLPEAGANLDDYLLPLNPQPLLERQGIIELSEYLSGIVRDTLGGSEKNSILRFDQLESQVLQLVQKRAQVNFGAHSAILLSCRTGCIQAEDRSARNEEKTATAATTTFATITGSAWMMAP